jgi:hypothetical protein
MFQLFQHLPTPLFEPGPIKPCIEPDPEAGLL